MTGSHVTRTFSVGRASFSVTCADADLKRTIESLFVDLDDGSLDDAWEPIEMIDRPGQELAVVRSGQQIGNPTSPLPALAKLVTTVNRIALDGDPTMLHLHAAALSHRGVGVLISAPSGTGKSTLAAALAEEGWSYVSDEMVGLKESSTLASGFPKPLLLKPNGEDILSHLAERSIRVEERLQHWRLVPASSLPATTDTVVEPRVIVLLHSSPGAAFDRPPTSSRLHPADAVVALMEQTMDAERYGEESVLLLARLAARSACVSLSIGRLEDCVAAIERFGTWVIEEMSIVPLDPFLVSHPLYQVNSAVRSMLIGDRAVVHDTKGGAIVALDEGGTAVWSALHGRKVAWWDDASMLASTTVSFLDELADHGLLERLDRPREGNIE